MRLIDADEFVSMNREAVHSMFNKVVDEAHPTDEQMSKATMFLEAVESVLENLENAPTIDAVPVVRCKDCKRSDWYTGANGKHLFFCLEHGSSGHSGDDYCSYGEREEDE